MQTVLLSNNFVLISSKTSKTNILFVFYFSSESHDDILNSLETELVQKNIELEMKDIEIQSQRKKIECLLLKVCYLSQQLKTKSNHISELDYQIFSLNQQLKGAEEKASQDHIQMELRQSKNCISQKFTDGEKIDTILEIKVENECGMNTEEAQTKSLYIDTASSGLTAMSEQQSQTVTRTMQEDIQSSETHSIIDKGLEGNNLSLYDGKTATDARSTMKDKKIDCKICSKTLASYGYLKQHVEAVHKKMKPHQCQICAKSFSQNSHLKVHVKSVHNTVMPLECKICAKKFATNSGLRKHINRIHNKLKL